MPKLFLNLIKLAIRVSCGKIEPRARTQAGVSQHESVGIDNQCVEGGSRGKKITEDRHQTWKDSCPIIVTGFSFNAGQGLTQQKWSGDKDCDQLYVGYITGLLLTSLIGEDSH